MKSSRRRCPCLPARPELGEGELGDVVEGLPSRHAQGAVLLRDLVRVEKALALQHRRLGRLQHRIEAAQHGEGQDDIAVLATDIHVAQPIIGNVPDEVGDPLELALVLLLLGCHSKVPCPAAATAAQVIEVLRTSRKNTRRACPRAAPRASRRPRQAAKTTNWPFQRMNSTCSVLSRRVAPAAGRQRQCSSPGSTPRAPRTCRTHRP